MATLTGGETTMGHRCYPGLRFHRGLDGRTYWYTDTYVGGRPPKGRRIYVRHGAVSQEEAETRHRRLLGDAFEIAQRRSLNLSAPSDAPVVHVGHSLREAAERWLAALTSAGTNPATIIRYRYDLDWAFRFLDPDSSKPLSAVTLEDLEAMRVGLKSATHHRGGSLSFRSRKNVERTTSMLFNFARRRRPSWISENPCDALMKERRSKRDVSDDKSKKNARFRTLHPREDVALLEACGRPWRKAAVGLGLYLGVRETPVASLRLEDVDVLSGLICVPCEINKGLARPEVRSDHWMPIPRRLRSLLDEQVRIAVGMKSPWLFPTGIERGRHSKSGHVNGRKLLDIAKTAAGAIGYVAPSVTFHDLRSVCINRLIASGLRDRTYQALSGARGIAQHASAECARPYIVGEAERLRPIIEAYDRWLDERSSASKMVSDLREKRVGK